MKESIHYINEFLVIKYLRLGKIQKKKILFCELSLNCTDEINIFKFNIDYNVNDNNALII